MCDVEHVHSAKGAKHHAIPLEDAAWLAHAPRSHVAASQHALRLLI